MATDDRRGLLRRARAHLEEWKFEGRAAVYAERFEGDDAVVTREELALLDRIDSELTRATGDGLWDADEYGIVTTDEPDGDGPRVVCTYHPEIPYEGYRGAESLDEATRAELNDVLWEYCEGVASVVQDRLDAFLREGGEP